MHLILPIFSVLRTQDAAVAVYTPFWIVASSSGASFARQTCTSSYVMTHTLLSFFSRDSDNLSASDAYELCCWTAIGTSLGMSPPR